MKLGFLFVISLAFILLAACKKNADPSVQQSSAFVILFDSFWYKMNSTYMYWDNDTTNWDNVYLKYHPLFAALNTNNANDTGKAIEYFKQISFGLMDSHLSIQFHNDNTVFYPAYLHRLSSPDFRAPVDYLPIDSAYFDAGFENGEDSHNNINNIPLQVTLATINHSILYFACNQFSLINSYLSTTNTTAKGILKNLSGLLNDLPPDIKGIIIDVRNNYGGNLADLNFLIGHLIDKPLPIGYSRSKNGEGRLDFTPWVESYITPWYGSKKTTVPVIALADKFSVSTAETVAMAIHLLPSGKVIGERTWGATGPLVNNNAFNPGQFSILNFMDVITSSVAFKYIDNNIYENIGFPPDISVPFNSEAYFAGIDVQLEKAIAILK